MPETPEHNLQLQHNLTAGLDSLEEGFMILDRQWLVAYANQAAGRWANCAPGEIQGQGFWSLFPGLESEPVYEAAHRAVAAGAPLQLEVQMPAGGLWAEWRLYPSEAVFTLLLRNITDRKQRQAALGDALAREQAAREEAEEARSQAEAAREASDAMMEELQTQREELEVSHEEAQAINEELHAANEELTFFNRELAQHRDEMQVLRDEAETVRRIGAMIAGELDTARLVQSVTDAATQLTSAEFGAFFYNVLDERGESYTLYALSGAPREAFDGFPMPRNTAIFAPTFHGTGVLRVDDVTADPRYGKNAPYHGMPEGHLPVRSYFAVPVISRSGEVLGGLFFGHSKAGVFKEAHERMVLGIASQAAVALDNARLYGEAKRASDSLKQSEERYRSLVQATSQVVWTADPSGAVKEDMPGWREITGGGPETVLGAGWLHDVHPDDQQRAIDTWRRATVAKSLYAVDYRIRARDGGYRHLMVRGVPVMHDGEVKEWVGLAYDVTEQKRLETALRESEELFRSLVEQSPLSVQILAPDGRTMQVNRAWEQLWGAKLEDLAHYNMLQDEHLDELGIGDYIRRAFNGEATAVPPVAYNRTRSIPNSVKEGDEPLRWVRAHIYPVVDSEGMIRKVVLIHDDFTARKRLEHELEERVRQMAEADRRKDEFLAMLAHEMRNPLSPILSSLGVLDRVGAKSKTAVRHRGVIARQTRQMARLLEDLLDVSRVEQGKIVLRLETTLVRNVIENAVETASPWIETRKHQISVELPDVPLCVEADPARLEQILVNLLSNAAKYTEMGGKITVSAARDDGFVCISVRDNGAGIPAEFLPHVFDLFSQGGRSLARSEGGLGIGLTLTRTLVEMHSGAITAHSAGPGLGSDFVIRLPLVDTPEWITAMEAPREPAVKTTPRSVLIIEDNRDAAESLAELLAIDGHAVRVAFDGPEGIRLAQAAAPEVVILDIGLPGMTGYEVAEQLRALPHMTQALLIAVTGYGQAADRKRALDGGFDHHLTKPTDPETIHRLLAKLP